MKIKLIILLTLMLTGRAMTLAFIPHAGGSNPGDPPIAWLMPLVGDAVIGLTGLFMIFLLLKKTGLWVWATILVWNAVAIWDALSAYLIHTTNPWPEFFYAKASGVVDVFYCGGNACSDYLFSL
jgi:hypothetical protein